MSEPTPGAGRTASIPAQGRDYLPRHRALPAAAGQASSDQLERVYETPVWVRPGDAHHAALPQQATPTHDRVATDRQVTPIERPEGLLRKARWVTPRSGRTAVMLLLLGSLAAAAATGTGVVTRQTTPALGLALSCLLAASGLYAILVATRPTVVELDEVWLTVRDRGRYDRFDLTNPFQSVAVSGKPGTSSWQLRLGCADGRVVVVNAATADSRELDRVVAYAQRYADRDRAARIQRFSR